MSEVLDRPTPLTPADCDLQDFPFMPLQVARLRDSDLAAEEHPEACWYAVLLWAASWHQLPAGSLPDNDVVLMKLCGLGRDVRTFRKHRDGALRGFVKCSDGRLYHPVVAEQVLAAWEGKIEQRWRTECSRIRKHNQRHGTAIDAPTLEQFKASGCSPALLDKRDASQGTGGDGHAGQAEVSHGTGAGCPAGNSLQGKGKGTGIEEKKIGAAPAGRGSRLPKDFVVPEDWLLWAMKERGWARRDVMAEAAVFIDYWTAKAGRDGVKLDWEATWRNWIRRSNRKVEPRGGVDAMLDRIPPRVAGAGR